MIDISIVGTGGMMPLHNRFLTAMVSRLRTNGSILLIDCGEGTQVTLKQLGWGLKAIDYICFTHFHADHISGLPGLLLTIGNSGRTEPLTIIGYVGVKKIVNSLRVIASELPFEIDFIELFAASESFSNPQKNTPVTLTLGGYKLSALQLDHSANCIGYSITLDRPGKFDAERATRQGIPLKLWSRLQKGEKIEHCGNVYTSDMVMSAPRKGIKVSYITDTRPIDTIPKFIYESDLFICEGLYGNDENQAKAEKRKHMIFSEAAFLAKKGNVKELWLTHYSPAMTSPEDYIEFATNIFENTKTGYDRMTKTIAFTN